MKKDSPDFPYPNRIYVESDLSKSNTRAKRTESITFRLDRDVLNKLRQEANRKDISVNTLISQIAKQHTSWHRLAAQAGFISLRRPLIMRLIEKHTDTEIRQLAKDIISTSNKDFVLLLRSRYNIHSALDAIETWVRIAGYPYNHDINELSYSNFVHSFVIQHEMGKKWSLYLSELYQNLFKEFGVQNYQFDVTPNTLAFDVVLAAEDKQSSGKLRLAENDTHNSIA